MARPKGSKDSYKRKRRSPNKAPDQRGRDPVEAAPLMRKVFVNGLFTLSKRKKKPLSEIMADWLEDDHTKVLNAMKGFLPRESDVKIEHRTITDYLQDVEEKAKTLEAEKQSSLPPLTIDGSFEKVS